jgi:hypothetical protein
MILAINCDLCSKTYPNAKPGNATVIVGQPYDTGISNYSDPSFAFRLHNKNLMANLQSASIMVVMNNVILNNSN